MQLRKERCQNVWNKCLQKCRASSRIATAQMLDFNLSRDGKIVSFKILLSGAVSQVFSVCFSSKKFLFFTPFFELRA